MLKTILGLMTCILLVAYGKAEENLTIKAVHNKAQQINGNATTGIGMLPVKLKLQAEATARNLIETLGSQQTFAMLGWQQNPDYKPKQVCFNHWHGAEDKKLAEEQINNCEQHVKDLSRLYASYGVEAKPILFKSDYYWDQKQKFNLAWPKLVVAWKAAGGNKENESYLKHPVCAKPLQKGWTGSDFFYDGQESPICRFYKIKAIEAKEAKEATKALEAREKID